MKELEHKHESVYVNVCLLEYMFSVFECLSVYLRMRVCVCLAAAIPAAAVAVAVATAAVGCAACWGSLKRALLAPQDL